MTAVDLAFRIRGLVAGYGAQDHVLKGVDLDVREGRLTVLVGPNGAGKSTLLKTLAGLLKPTDGTILLHAQRIDGLAPRAVARAGVSYVPQEHNVFDSMRVRENLEVAAWLDRGHWRARAEALFRRFPLLAQRAGQAPRTFSGGQRQVLAMAMGLMSDPRVLLLDEPSAGLSPVAAQQLFREIAAIRDQGRTVVMVEQHADEALRIADDGCVLVDGRVARAGPAHDIAADPQIRRLFLGG